jgi:hypothetical protein
MACCPIIEKEEILHKKTTSQNRNPSFLFEICGYDDDITTIDLIGDV